MSDYSTAESDVMKTNFGFIKLIRNEINNLNDTASFISKANKVITVDTSLGHLATLCDRDVELLLPLFPDERWLDLLEKEGVYKDRITPHRQNAFHQWGTALQSLEINLSINLDN